MYPLARYARKPDVAIVCLGSEIGAKLEINLEINKGAADPHTSHLQRDNGTYRKAAQIQLSSLSTMVLAMAMSVPQPFRQSN